MDLKNLATSAAVLVPFEWTVVNIIEDVGSGAKERPNRQELLNLAKSRHRMRLRTQWKGGYASCHESSFSGVRLHVMWLVAGDLG